MKFYTTLFAFLFAFSIQAQNNFNMCTSAGTELSSGNIFDSGGPTGNYSDFENCLFLIEPPCAGSITLSFSSFNINSGDYLEVFDDNTVNSSNRILYGSGTSLPSAVTANSGKMLLRFVSNSSFNSTGFSASWSSTTTATNPPTANFSTNVSNPNYNQTIQFFDGTSNNPASRLWNFGDSTFSTVTNPTKAYNQSGTYRVSLEVENCLGKDTRTKNLYLRPPSNFDASPKIINATTSACGDSITVPVKLYNNSGSSMSFTSETKQGKSFEEEQNKSFNTLNAINFFPFSISNALVDGDLQIKVDLTGSFNFGSRYADLYIDNSYYARVYSNGLIATPTQTQVQNWLSDGVLNVELRNSGNVFITGNDNHNVEVIVKRTDWIDIINPNITIPANDSATLNVKLKSENLSAGNNYGSILVDNGNTGFPFSILVNHQVFGSPNLSILGSTINNFGTVQQFATLNDTLTIQNIGCDTLFIDSINSSSTFLTYQSVNNFILPYDGVDFISQWQPNTIGANNDSVVISTNSGSRSINYNATVIAAPFASIDPNPIVANISNCNDSVSVSININNLGSSNLVVDSITTSNSDDDLDSVLARINQSGSSLTTLIPSNYNFLDGVSGNQINDGGGDMYDGANRLNIFPSSSSSTTLLYSDNILNTNAAIGAGNEYFTRKLPGLFFFAADISGVNVFSITGNLGADGSGSVSTSILNSSANGVNYTGYVKRVYNAGDPSINHLIIIENDPTVSRTYLTNTNNENHRVNGLTNTSRIYYVLFAGTSGRLYSDQVFQNVFDEFLRIINAAPEADWLSVQNYTGNIGATSSDTIEAKFYTKAIKNGQYISSFTIHSNNSSNSNLIVPCTLNVNGSAEAVFSDTCISFGNRAQSGSYTEKIYLENLGCDTLRITGISNTSSDFSVSYDSSILDVGDTSIITADFNPTSVGTYTDTIIVSTNVGTYSICLSGNGTPAPTISVSPPILFGQTFVCGDSVLVPLTIKNNGLGELNYSISDSTSTSSTSSGPSKILILTYGATLSELSNVRNFLSANFLSSVVTETNSTFSNVVRDSLVGKSLVIIPETYNYVQLNNCRTEIQNFVANGGGFIQIGGNIATLNATGIFQSSGISSGSTSTMQKTSISHPVTTNVSASFNSITSWNYSSISNTGFQSLLEVSGNIVVGVSNYGNGKAVLYGFDYSQTSTDVDQILENSINWVANNVSTSADWIGGNFPSDSIAAGDSMVLNIPFYSDSLRNGFYYSSINITSNDPANPILNVPCTLQVSGQPEVSILPAISCLGFDTIPNGGTKLDSINIVNTGCDTLTFTGLAFSGTSYSATFLQNSILPGDTAVINISFIPTSVGTHNDSLNIQYNGGNKKLCVSGYAEAAPNIQVSPDPIVATINSCNDSTNIAVSINNLGSGNLIVDSVTTTNYSGDLDSVLARINRSGTTLPGLIPFSYAFFDGVFGNNISDGGGDMYDGGNFLNIRPTSSSALNLQYSDNALSTNTALGAGNEYFTRKIPGMFFFAADISNVSEFSITGNLGADGSGSVAAAILNSSSNGVNYKGFVKKVYNAFDPSINHLIIVEDNASISRLYNSTTNNENHRINGLTNSTRIYYILFAGTNGRLYSDAQFQTLMDAFLNTINAGSSADWIKNVSFSGTVGGSSSDTIRPRFVSTGLPNGQYITDLTVHSNDPSNPSLIVPCTLNVNGSPDLSFINTSCLDFGSQFRFSRTTDSLKVVNNGCATATISNATAGGAFSIVSRATTINPGDTKTVVIDFFPGTLGSQADSVKLFYQNSGVSTSCLIGNSIAPPQIALSPSNYTASLNVCDDSASFIFGISNNGASDLNWNFQPALSPYEDDFEFGFNNTLWLNTNSNVISGSCGAINGTNSALLTGNSRTLETRSMDATFADSISFSYNSSNCNGVVPAFYRYFQVQVSINGGISWNNLASYITSSLPGPISVNITLPAFAKTSNSRFRIINPTYGSNTTDTWLIDDFKVSFSTPPSQASDLFSFTTDSGTVVAMDAINIGVKINPDGLTPGLQTRYIRVYSNDPVKPVDSIPVFINLNGVPCSEFIYDASAGCNGSVAFTDTSKGSPTSWFWTFGNSTSSNLKNPTVSYSTAGVYAVQLVACNSYGCDTTIKQIAVNPILAPRNASCTPSTNNYCCGYGVTNVTLGNINNNSLVGAYEDFSCTQRTTLTSGNAYTISVSTGNFEDAWAWIDYNDDGSFQSSELIMSSFSSTSHSTSFTVPTSANLNAPLRMRVGSQDNGYTALTGCNNSFRGQYEDYSITIQSRNASPSANFSDTLISVCQGVVSFSDESLNFPTSWVWDFGDGNSSTNRNPFHTYSTRGTFQVKLIVSNTFGVDSITRTVIINKPIPVINAIGSLAVDSLISFNVSGVNGGSNYSWNLGNNQTSTSVNPSTTYAAPNIYTVSVSLIDANNCNVNASLNLPIIITGINGNTIDDLPLDVKLYPNPVTNKLTVSTELLNYKISVYNSIGALVIQQAENNRSTQIDFSELSSNIYYIVIKKQGQIFRKKVVKTN